MRICKLTVLYNNEITETYYINDDGFDDEDDFDRCIRLGISESFKDEKSKYMELYCMNEEFHIIDISNISKVTLKFYDMGE